MADELNGHPESPLASGLVLADLPRGDGQEHVRVSVVEHRGARFVSVRTWSRATGGVHRPTPRGVHLRASELRAVRDALDAAVALVGNDAATDHRTVAPS